MPAALRTSHFTLLNGQPLQRIAAVRTRAGLTSIRNRPDLAPRHPVHADTHAVLSQPEIRLINPSRLHASHAAGFIGHREMMRRAEPAAQKSIRHHLAIEQDATMAEIAAATLDHVAVHFSAVALHVAA